MKFVNYRHNLRPALRIQHGCRLVEDNALWFHSYYTGNGYALLLTSGKKMGCFFLELTHIHIGKSLINSPPDFCRLDAEIFRSESHVILYNSRDQLVVGILKNHSRSLTYIPYAVVIPGIESVYIYDPFCRKQQAVKVFCQSRFTGTVFTYDSGKTAPFYLQIQIVNGPDRLTFITSGIFKYQVFYGYDVIHLFLFLVIFIHIIGKLSCVELSRSRRY